MLSVDGKRFTLIFPEGKVVAEGSSILALKLWELDVIPLVLPLSCFPVADGLSKQCASSVPFEMGPVAKQSGAVSEEVWIQLGDKEVLSQEKMLKHSLVGHWGEFSDPILDSSLLKWWVVSTWNLIGTVKLLLLGGVFFLMEFVGALEAKQVLLLGPLFFDNKLVHWAPDAGCFNRT